MNYIELGCEIRVSRIVRHHAKTAKDIDRKCESVVNKISKTDSINQVRILFLFIIPTGRHQFNSVGDSVFDLLIILSTVKATSTFCFSHSLTFSQFYRFSNHWRYSSHAFQKHWKINLNAQTSNIFVVQLELLKRIKRMKERRLRKRKTDTA